MNEVKLDRNTLINLGTTISDTLLKANIKEESYLKIIVDDISFKKIDEDLFYRGENDEKKEFEPSEDNIQLKFNNLLIIIEKKIKKYGKFLVKN